jgi:hypothetical protein
MLLLGKRLQSHGEVSSTSKSKRVDACELLAGGQYICPTQCPLAIRGRLPAPESGRTTRPDGRPLAGKQQHISLLLKPTAKSSWVLFYLITVLRFQRGLIEAAFVTLAFDPSKQRSCFLETAHVITRSEFSRSFSLLVPSFQHTCH